VDGEIFPFSLYTLAKSSKYRRKYIFGAPSESDRKMWFEALDNYYHIGVGTASVTTPDVSTSANNADSVNSQNNEEKEEQQAENVEEKTKDQKKKKK
jgi:hypothetical protein